MTEQLKSGAQPLASDGDFAELVAGLATPAILILDGDASIRFWNRGAELLYGWTAEQALGRPLSWLMEGAGDPALARAELAAVRMSGAGERQERRRHADGTTITVGVRKTSGHSGCFWEMSALDARGEPLPSGLSGIEEMVGAAALVFDGTGRLSESSAREVLPEPAIERARTLALKALRTGSACEEPGAGADPWLRASPILREGEPAALVLVRPALSGPTGGEAEARRVSELCRRLFDAQEAERRRLARELHDELGQSLTGLLYALENEKASRKQLRREASALLAKVRGLSQGLRPGILDDLGLAAALRWLADRQQRQCGVEVVANVACGSRRWPEEMETALFRIAQEALTNAAKHASAKRITIGVNEKGGELQMTIEDDGIGFEPSSPALKSTGLYSMRERASLLGGRFDLESAPGEGTRIRVGLPLLREADR